MLCATNLIGLCSGCMGVGLSLILLIPGNMLIHTIADSASVTAAQMCIRDRQMQTQQLHIIPVSQHTAGRPAAVVPLQGDSQLRTHHVGLGRHLLQQLAQIQRVKLRRLPGTQK